MLATTAVLLVAAGCQPEQSETMQANPMTKSIRPFLMFQDGRAEEAINRYIEVFGDARIVFMQRYGENPVARRKVRSSTPSSRYTASASA